jgi:hypothetical protein
MGNVRGGKRQGVGSTVNKTVNKSKKSFHVIDIQG